MSPTILSTVFRCDTKEHLKRLRRKFSHVLTSSLIRIAEQAFDVMRRLCTAKSRFTAKKTDQHLPHSRIK
jgi:hypothetical protein